MEHDHDLRASIAALMRIAGVGWMRIEAIQNYLIKHEIGWPEFWVMSATKLQKIGVTEKQIDSIKIFKKEHTFYSYYESLQVRNIQVVLRDDKLYPPLLRQTGHPPPALFVRGSPKPLAGLAVAVVGTRSVTAYGVYVTQLLVSQLVSGGCSIISGGMYGVDMIAHQAATAAGGETWVFLGHGFDHLYPESVREQHLELAAAGAVFCSPFAPEVRPSRATFPVRNQIVAGSSAGVVVTEAAEKSGSHITAACALDEGRQVFAVPGPITNPYSVGTQALLAQGATCVLSGEQIITELSESWSINRLSREVAAPETIDPDSLDADSAVVYAAVQSGSTTLTALASTLPLTTGAIQAALSILELRGFMSVRGGHMFIRERLRRCDTIGRSIGKKYEPRYC